MQKVRLLCLHGKNSNSEEFAQSLEPLRNVAVLTFMDAPHGGGGGGYVWWHLPPGERSYTSPHLDGLAESTEAVRDAWEKHGPFDGILGFSQGAILIAALAITGVLMSPAAPEDEEGRALRPRALLLFGAALPGPFKDRFTSSGSFHALHVIGDNDTVNPPDGARSVARGLGGEVWVHGGGHVIPLDGEALGIYERFLGNL